MIRKDIMKDSYPGKPRILFIALAQSTHTHAWVRLLTDYEINVRVFGIDKTEAPDNFEFPTYSFTHKYEKNNKSQNIIINSLRRLIKIFSRIFVKKYSLRYEDIEGRWLSGIINRWKPDIIHTLGLDPASFAFYRIKNEFLLSNSFKWVVTLRGGPEFALKRLLPREAKRINNVFSSCNQIIADNKINYKLACKLGLEPSKLASIGVVPGAGGVDVDELFPLRKELTSKSRTILYPKAYECPASKALPIFEALKISWGKINPCKIYMTSMMPETRMWFQSLPEYIRKSCFIEDRIQQEELINLMATSRILLIPSLSDGIPNTLYEAMAVGAFPIVSPIDTIQSIVSNEKNVLFARNLYPKEIADALIKAMTDDALVDRAVERNIELVKKIANRKLIKLRVIEYYRSLTSKHE